MRSNKIFNNIITGLLVIMAWYLCIQSFISEGFVRHPIVGLIAVILLTVGYIHELFSNLTMSNIFTKIITFIFKFILFGISITTFLFLFFIACILKAYAIVLLYIAALIWLIWLISPTLPAYLSLLFLRNNCLKKSITIFHLYNKKASVIYNIKQNRLSVYNLLNTKQNFYMSSLNAYRPIDLFRTIAEYFNMNTTYDALLTGFKAQRIDIVAIDTIDNIKQKSNNEKQQNQGKKTLNIISIVNINNAGQEEIAKLPGINIIQAKKAVQYRQEKGGFKTKQEFFKVVNLKRHYMKMIYSDIIVGKYNVLNEYNPEEIKNTNQEGREVDF